MTIKVCTYVPALTQDLLPRIVERFSDAGMDCEFDPKFALNRSKDSGVVSMRLCVKGDGIPHYTEADLLSSFEISFKDFRYTSPVSTNPAINQRLKQCNILVIVRMHANPTSSLRAGLYFSVFLAEATDGVVYSPQSDQYMEPDQALAQLGRQVAAYEAELPPQDWMMTRFTGW